MLCLQDVEVRIDDGTDGISLDGRRIYCLEAITKDKADEGAKEQKEKKSKDSRNLYLAREGLVREGTLAAEGVSKADMAKRTQLNRWKKTALKDLNMFVSPVRLCVRNLPSHLAKDKALRVLIKKHCNDPNAKVTGELAFLLMFPKIIPQQTHDFPRLILNCYTQVILLSLVILILHVHS